MAFAFPHADVAPPALVQPYSAPAPIGNSLAVPAPVRWPSARYVAPKGELAALLETAAAHGLGASAVAVLAALWSWSNADGLAWPCVESIARRSGVSRRTAFAALAQLETAGLVVRQVPLLRARRVRRESNTYRLPTPRDAQPALPFPSPMGKVTSTPSSRPPRRVAPRPPSPMAPSVEPAGPPTPQPGAAPAERQVQRLHPKGPTQNQNQNARADAQVRETPGDSRPTTPETPSAELVEPVVAKRPTRAERSAANRAAWAARARPAPSSRPIPAPRRAPSPRSFVAPHPPRVHDPQPALAALRAWREGHQFALPAVDRPDPAERPSTPAQPPRWGDPSRRAPAALGRLLAPFARLDGAPHRGGDGSTPAPRHGAAGAPPSPLRAIDTSSPRTRPEGRAAPLWRLHPSR